MLHFCFSHFYNKNFIIIIQSIKRKLNLAFGSASFTSGSTIFPQFLQYLEWIIYCVFITFISMSVTVLDLTFCIPLNFSPQYLHSSESRGSILSILSGICLEYPLCPSFCPDILGISFTSSFTKEGFESSFFNSIILIG